MTQNPPPQSRLSKCYAGSIGGMRSKNADWKLLTAWLVERNEPVVTIPWNELNDIVGGLPDSAINHYAQWWYGDRPHTRAWRRAGYELTHLDLERAVTLKQVTVVVSLRQTDSPRAHPAALRHAGQSQFQQASGVTLETIDPRSALIVLPCSSAKRRGGAEKSATFRSDWSTELLLARERVRDIAQVDDQLIMPAWQRYTGGLYEAAGSSLSDAVSAGANIAILSGGYGVVHADEDIGWYDRMLKKSDWPNHVLVDALIAEAIRIGAQNVVAFAARTTDYAKIIRSKRWHEAGIRRAVLVTSRREGGGAMSKVPPDLGAAFAAFWSRRPEEYPADIWCEELT